MLIVGAGIAGLTAGLLLKQAGHHVTIIEANGNRIGGRIKTFHTDPGHDGTPFADPAQYAEAGAMRIPNLHPLTLALIDKLGLPRRLFYNVDIVAGTGKEDAPVPAVTYQSFDGTLWSRGPDTTAFRAPNQASHTWIRTNDQQARRSEYAADPTLISNGFQLPGDEEHFRAERLRNQLDHLVGERLRPGDHVTGVEEQSHEVGGRAAQLRRQLLDRDAARYDDLAFGHRRGHWREVGERLRLEVFEVATATRLLAASRAGRRARPAAAGGTTSASRSAGTWRTWRATARRQTAGRSGPHRTTGPGRARTRTTATASGGEHPRAGRRRCAPTARGRRDRFARSTAQRSRRRIAFARAWDRHGAHNRRLPARRTCPMTLPRRRCGYHRR